VRIVWYHNSITIQLEFTPEIQETLNYERYHHPLPLVQRRMEVLWLKSHHLPPARIAQLAHVSENTMREYFQRYAEGGVEKLKEVHCYRPHSELQAHLPSLEAYFRAPPPATVKEAQSEIEALTGIKRSETQVREFLKKNSICAAARSA
jgi:transposase